MSLTHQIMDFIVGTKLTLMRLLPLARGRQVDIILQRARQVDIMILQPLSMAIKILTSTGILNGNIIETLLVQQ